jgi:2-polyprenyl-3-methyl-5-hydroxy-6-metoxy-1,4-benzoquinol methylase
MSAKKHWEKEKIVSDFDDIYDNKGGLLVRLANRFLRPSLKARIPVTIKECGDLTDKKVLDIGCGSGRISFLLAKKGANVTGVDYSQNMINLAKKYQTTQDLPNIEFIHGDLEQFSPDKKYDISIALGVVDYVDNAKEFLSKTNKLTKNKSIVSFHIKYSYNSLPRKLWLMSKHCPVKFYTKNEIIKLYASLGVKKELKIITIPENSLFPTQYLVTVYFD